MGLVLQAGIAQVEGDRQRAIAALQAAVRELETADMSHYAAAGRLRLSQLLAGEAAQEELRRAEIWMANHNVRRPDSIADVLVPGLRVK